MTKLLFADLDGTLLKDDKTISSELKQGILSMIDQGHSLILSSGRPYNSILSVKESLDLPDKGVLINAYNGGLLIDCSSQEILIEQRLLRTDVSKILQLAYARDLHCQTYSDTHIVSERRTKEIELYSKHVNLPIIFAENAESVLENGPFKMMAISYTSKETLAALGRDISLSTNGRLTTLFSNDNYLEILPSTSGKGKGIEFLCEHLNLSITNAISVGDAENDSSMIITAGLGVAMANATEDLKRLSNYVTSKDNNHDGLLEVIEKFILS